jgi:hypothetical protein
LDGPATRYTIGVGSCLQWQAFRGTTLLLKHDQDQKLVAIRTRG